MSVRDVLQTEIERLLAGSQQRIDLANELMRDVEIADCVLALLRFARWKVEARTLHVLVDGEGREEKTMHTIRDNERFSCALEARSAAGNPTTVESPAWSTSDENLLEVTPSADGMSAVVRAKGPVGTAQLRVDADADLGEGVRQISGTLDVEVLAGDAAAIELRAGPAEEQ